ncbi:XH domain-containing protein [Heracleum sosnowskyi]|uniref:XH domain-containing protein n=1 Tax=Heracleum sosnowskyi TaxID=360622 RepID=A0AAD8GSE0_9APIA|nr:XH domain-containing protein [Heracleum sosnowskyi]
MSQSSSSANKNGCSSALHRACLELQGAASNIVKLIDQEKNGSEAAGKEHNEYQDSIINALTVENFKLKEENGTAKSLLISNLPEYFGDEFGIEIKLIGEIDIAPFISIFTRRQSAKLSNESMITKATETCTHWQEKIKDSAWSPFKKVTIDGISKEIVDDNDVELKKLRKEMGFSVFMAVKIALEEINKHNPSGRYPVAKLWHVKENREAKLDEIMQGMLKKTTRKRKAGDDSTGQRPPHTK